MVKNLEIFPNTERNAKNCSPSQSTVLNKLGKYFLKIVKTAFELSKTTLRKNVKFFTTRGVPYGQKVTQSRKNGWENIFKKIWNIRLKGTEK